jgi:hypothetical protein
MESKNKNKTWLIAALVALVVIGGGLLVWSLVLDDLFNRPAENPGTGTQANNPVGTQTAANVNLPNAITIDPQAPQLIEVGAGYCVALIPDGWSFASPAPYAGADILSADKRIHAAWEIASLNKSLYPTEDSALTQLMNPVYPGFTLTSPKTETAVGFWSRDFSSGTGQKGTLFYMLYDADPNIEVISVYAAATDSDLWDTRGALALSSAISIRCLSQLRPSTASLDLGSANPSDPSANPEVVLSSKWTEALMGSVNVYSPALGEHYLVSPGSYWADGPQGGGYYRQLPEGGYELLQVGFGEY